MLFRPTTVKELVNIAKSRGKERVRRGLRERLRAREKARDLKRWESGGGRNVCVSWQIENGAL